MADFYFFTEPEKLDPQTSDQAFGSVLNTDPAFETGKDKYRITDIHTGVNAPAIAVCDGLVCVQPDSPTTYCIILKPIYQPSFDFPFIKFFLYKGIQRSSLVNNSNEIIVDVNNQLTSFLQIIFGPILRFIVL